MRLKPLSSSLKEKKRYVAFEVISENKMSYADATNAIIENYKKYYGLMGMAKSSLHTMEDWKNQRGIMVVNNKHVDELKSSLALIKNINNHNVIVRCLGVSGLLNKARSKYLG